MKSWLVAAIVGAGTAAAAGPLGDALARHGADDVAALRAHLADASARCTLGAVYAARGDLVHAALFLDGCDDATLDPEIAGAVQRAASEVAAKLEASPLSAMTISSDPPGLAVTTDALPGESLTTPATIWVKAGRYSITGGGRTMAVELAARTRVPVVFERGTTRLTATPTSRQLDFTDEPIGDNQGPPPAAKHPSLLPCKYRGCDTHGGETIDDPFAVAAEHVPMTPPSVELGVRVGTSAAFHAGGSRIAPSVALDGRVRAGRFPGLGPAAVDVRLDWAMRGGADADFDAYGASAQYGAVVAAPRAAWLWLFAGLRGELRTDVMLGGQPVERTGVGYTAALELALRALPVVVGVRYDEDLTDLVPGVRERAVIVELGAVLRAGVR